MKTMTQKFAECYSETGSQQFLVAVYDDEAILYAQVSEATAGAIQSRLALTPGIHLVESPAQSADGLTWCWAVRRTDFSNPNDWVSIIMSKVRQVFAAVVPSACDDLYYVDNRRLDANTLESFASILGN